MGFAGGVFNPQSLFANGELGWWYDLSDFSNMFQDRAGTTPVTAAGQFVGHILDKSGNANHWTAPTDAARPTLVADGIYFRLHGNGTTQYGLTPSNVDVGATKKLTVFLGCNKVTGNNNAMLVSLGAYAAVGSMRIVANGGSIENYEIGSAPATSVFYRAPLVGSTTNIVCAQWDNSISSATLSDQLKIRIDGAAVVPVGAGSNSGAFVAAKVSMCAAITGALFFSGGVYQSIGVEGLLIDNAETTANVETYIASKNGVVLP